MSGDTETNEQIRNIAIIAHVDHGKTTLVDQMFRQSGLFRENAQVEDRIMDSGALEKERGITISAKNCSVVWNDVKVNILDTPGHADFGGEVERALMMVDGAILLVDSAEGPLPQTRFVLQKALQRSLPIIVVVNKIDRKDARPQEVLDEIYDLFIDLDADESQLDFPVIYAIGRDGVAKRSLEEESENLSCLFDEVLTTIPGPSSDPEEPFQMLVLDLGYSDYLGRLATGRVFHGRARKNENLICIGEHGTTNLKVSELQGYEGAGLYPLERAEPGEIVVLAGAENVKIGDTICTAASPRALPRVSVDEPTIAMRFMVNTSPLSGQEGKHVQFPRIKQRLQKETLHNVSMQVEEADGDTLIVKGRGELQMAVLVETMRREGFELAVGRPEVLVRTHKETGAVTEPVEHIVIDVEEQFVGVITEKLATRKGRMVNLQNRNGRSRLEFSIPSRGLIGYRSEFLTDTKGTGLMNSYLSGFEEFRGEISSRKNGSLVADRSGEAVPYALFNLEPRGRLFISPNEKVYEGMVIGEHNRPKDLNVNPCKAKKLTNVRASGKDENVVLTPIVPLALEVAVEFINDDEIVEVTPKSIRIRKKVLQANQRK